MKNKVSTIKKIDENTFAITDYEVFQPNIKFHIKIKIKIVLLFVIIALACIFVAIYNNNSIPFTNDIQNTKVINESGFVFPNSSTSYLSADDIQVLEDKSYNSGYIYQELLRLAINEIYARHGYQFIKGEQYDVFYRQFDWYNNIKKSSVSWSQFNEIEKSNLTLLINIEHNNGFRQ